MPQEYVLITTLSHFKSQFAIPLEEFEKLNFGDPIDREKLLSALESLPVKEFSQTHLGEVVADAVIYDEQDILSIFDVENTYLNKWSTEKKLEWINNWKEQPF